MIKHLINASFPILLSWEDVKKNQFIYLTPRKQEKVKVNISLFSKLVIESYSISIVYVIICTNNFDKNLGMLNEYNSALELGY